MIHLVKGKEHNIIKRDGRIEKYYPEKTKKVLMWAFKNSEPFVKEIMKDMDIKIYDKIRIEKLYDEMIVTALNKISEMYPDVYDEAAKRLFLQKIYKEIWGLKRTENIYPDYLEVLKKGVSYNVYDDTILNYFSEDELKELGKYIKPQRDFNFTAGGLMFIMDKYAAKYSKRKYLELPQHVYMRVAIFEFHKETKNRIQLIKDKYDDLSLFRETEATPKMLNAMKKNPQLMSCVLMRPDDDSLSINYVSNAMGLFSKFAGGLGIDVSWLRSKNSPVAGNNGISSGVVPFIQLYEKTVQAYNQGGARPGSAAIYFDWFHYESPEICMLKDAGGKDAERARGLKYAIKWSKLLSKRFLNNEEISLFNPKDVPELLETFNDEFNEYYIAYEQKNIKKKKMSARDLTFTVGKIRSETGNLYVYLRDNVDAQRMGVGKVYQSNLCTEIFLPTLPLTLTNEELFKDVKKNKFFATQQIEGEIALCNLSSVNLVTWVKMSENEKKRFIYNLLRSSDNCMDYAFYPVKAGESFNINHRAIGIGTSNYANCLALNKIKFTDKEALKFTHEIYEDLSWHILYASTQLAKERGKYPLFEGSKWSEGKVPLDISILNNMKSDLNYPLKKDWDLIRNRILEYGVRFEYHMAIAPTQSSGLVINATEGTEPIRKFKIMKEGTYNIPFIAPNLKKNREYYEKAWDIPNKTLLDLAAIRQKFIDQGQSINLYYKKTDSASEIIKDIIYAEILGLKSLYYLNPEKDEVVEECESCSS